MAGVEGMNMGARRTAESKSRQAKTMHELWQTPEYRTKMRSHPWRGNGK